MEALVPAFLRPVNRTGSPQDYESHIDSRVLLYYAETQVTKTQARKKKKKKKKERKKKKKLPHSSTHNTTQLINTDETGGERVQIETEQQRGTVGRGGEETSWWGWG